MDQLRAGSGYADQINAALDHVGGRCRYILELQTREIPNNPTPQRDALLRALDAPFQTTPSIASNESGSCGVTAISLFHGQASGLDLLASVDSTKTVQWCASGSRKILHLVDHLRPSRWRSYGGAHSVICDSLLSATSTSQRGAVLDGTMWGISLGAKSDAQIAVDQRSLRQDIVAADSVLPSTVTLLQRAIASRARFYLAESTRDAALYRDIIDRRKFFLGVEPMVNPQEIYVSCLRLVDHPTTDPDQALLCALDAATADPRRYEVLHQLLHRAVRRGCGTTFGRRCLALASERIVWRNADDPSLVFLDFVPGREPRPPEETLFPALTGQWQFWWKLGIVAESLDEYRLAYAAYYSLLARQRLDPQWALNTNDREFFKRACQRVLPLAYPQNNRPLPLIAADP